MSPKVDRCNYEKSLSCGRKGAGRRGSFQKNYSYLLIQKSPEHGQWDIKEQYPGQCLHIHNELLLQERGKKEQAEWLDPVFLLGVEMCQGSKRRGQMQQEGISLDLGKSPCRHKIFLQVQLTGYFSAAQSSQCCRFGMSPERLLKRLEIAN